MIETVFQLFSKSEKFTKKELLDSIEYMSKTDLCFKSTDQKSQTCTGRCNFSRLPERVGWVSDRDQIG